jgi:FHS family L-fucose permease-like MFS transporter
MLIFAACLAVFVYGMVASMLGTINPGLAERFQLDNVQTGYMALAQGVGLTIASVSVGPLIDRRGKKVGLLLGLGLVGAAMLGLANATGYLTILAAMLVMGVGGGITLTGANALGSDVSESRRASVLNFLNVFVGLGGLVTPFVAGNLLAGDSVRVAYGAACLALAAFLTHALLRIPTPRPAEGVTGKSRAVFREPVLYLFASITFLYTACEFGVWNWLPKYLIAQGIPEPVALTILSLGFALGLLLGRVVVAPVLIKVSPLTVTLAAAALMALTSYAMRHTADQRTAAIVVFCGGLAMAPVFPTTVAMVGNYFRSGTATAIGFTITCGFSGLTLSSPVIGWLAGPDPQGIGRGLLVLPIASLAIIGVNLALRRALRRRAI